MADESVRGGTDAVPVLGDLVGSDFAQRVKLDAGGDGLSLPVTGDQGIPVQLIGTDVLAANAGAAGQYFVTMPAVAGKTNYVSGFEVTGTGATAASAQNVYLTGVLGSLTLIWVIAVPAGVNNAIIPLHFQFTRPIPASGVNVAIQLNVPNFGAGNTLSAGQLHGFYK